MNLKKNQCEEKFFKPKKKFILSKCNEKNLFYNAILSDKQHKKNE